MLHAKDDRSFNATEQFAFHFSHIDTQWRNQCFRNVTEGENSIFKYGTIPDDTLRRRAEVLGELYAKLPANYFSTCCLAVLHLAGKE